MKVRDRYMDDFRKTQDVRDIYHAVLMEHNIDTNTSFDLLPYYVTRELEQRGIYDDSFLKDAEKTLKNEGDSGKLKQDKGVRKRNTRRVYGDGRYNTRQNCSLVNEFGENQDNGYNFDEFDM